MAQVFSSGALTRCHRNKAPEFAVSFSFFFHRDSGHKQFCLLSNVTLINKKKGKKPILIIVGEQARITLKFDFF